MTLQKLPIAIQTFSKLRHANCVYADKTQQIYELAATEGAYFLSRPRRFGKSLLLDTIKELFEGNQSLFEGLYIYDKWDWSKTNPVIRIDFAVGDMDSMDKFKDRIYLLLQDNMRRLALDCDLLLDRGDTVGCFERLIQKAHEHFGQKVVILIDEYDKPILDNIVNHSLANEIREALRSFYSVMKAQDAHIQFILMTGVTKFSKVSLFSGVNQIQDISLHPRYATICGYTQHDLETSFAQHLAGVDWDKLKHWYNGYNFLGDSVYNPYDVLLFIDEQHNYRSHWASTGNMHFMHQLFRQKPFFVPDIETIEADDRILTSFDIERIDSVTLLYQTGYLTIDTTYRDFNDQTVYRLRIPNKEVKLALYRQFIDAYADQEPHVPSQVTKQLYKHFTEQNLSGVQELIIGFFADIPWRNFTNTNLEHYEGYYASILYSFFKLINAQVIPEKISVHGQVDLTIILGNLVYVIEIKLDKSEPYQVQTPNPALAQIQGKQYSMPYLGSDKQVYEVGMIFNATARNLVQMD